MALLQRTRILPQQRLDLPDFRNIEDFVCADFKAQFKNIWTGENFVLKGFATTGIGTNAISMALAGSALLVGADDGTMFIGAPSLSPATSDALTPASTNYVELSIEQDTGGADSRAFWDPTAAAGQGGEFSQIVDTFIFNKVKLNINTSNFTGAADTVPICEVDVNGSGIITDIRDARNMFWRLGRRGQSNFSYSWASRTEPPTAQFNGADKDIDSEKAWKDAVMSRILELDGGNYWFEDSGVSNVGSFRNSGLSMTTSQSTDAKWSWDGSLLKLTDSNLTPADADAVAAVRLFDSTANLMLTRQDGTGGSTAFALADGDVLWVKLPDPLANVNYSGIGLTASNFRVSPRGSVPNDDTTFWLAFRDGVNVYLRYFGELQPGEDVEISDNVNENILAAIGIAEETDMPNYTSNNIVVDNTSLVAAISALDAAAGVAGIQANQDRSLKLIEGGTWSVNMAGNNISWSADAFIDVPEVTRVSNRILAGNITLPNANSVAYVEINRASGPATLTVNVADIDALTPTENTVIIARRVTAGILVGRSCFLLKAGEYLELDGALAEINRKLGQLKLRPHETSPFKARIDAGDITQLDSSVLSQIIGDFLLKFDGAVINFQTGVINKADDVTALGVNFTPFSIPASQYFWYGVSLIPGNVLADNTQEAQVQIDLAASANAVQATAPKPVISGDIKLGAIQIFNNAGSLQISETRKLGVGSGSGSGSGDASAVDTALRDRFSLNNFLFLTENIFRTDKDTKYDVSSTGAYAPAKKAFGFSSAGQTLVSKNSLDSDFLDDGIDISETELYLFWLAGFIDTAATYELSRDGGTNWQTASVTRVGLSNAYRVHHVFTEEVTPQSLQTVAATGAGTALNSTTAQQLSSQLVLANTSVIKTIDLNLNRAAAAVGNLYVQLVKDNAGVPSTATADILAESDALNIANFGTGNVTISVDMPDTTLVAGTYHIVLRTDSAYKAGTMDLSWRSGSGTNGAAYNGTVWTGSASTKAATVKGRALDLRVRVTSSVGNVYIEGYGLYYDSSIGIQPSSTRKIQKFVFSGDLNQTNFTCNFQLDPYILTVHDVYRGQSYVPDSASDSPLRVDGNTLKFAADTFNFPGETIVLIVRQLEGNGVDVSQENSAKIFEIQQQLVDIGDELASISDSMILPKVAAPFTTVQNRALMPDLSQDLKIRFGVDRMPIQKIYPILDESGPNGEAVYGAVNDKFSQVRFMGSWSDVIDQNGQYASAGVGSSVEISFYGTGLNLLGFSSGFARTWQVAVDGVNTSTVSTTTSNSNILTARYYSQNVPFNLTANRTLGFHTVKLTVTAGDIRVFGFEVINEQSSGLLVIPPGSQLYKGKRKTHTTLESVLFNSVFETGTLGTKGGRVLVYQKADDSIVKSVTPTDASAAYLASASHANEEIVRTHHPREFGSWSPNDFSSIESSPESDRWFALDDGSTMLVGDNVQMVDPGLRVGGSVANLSILITFTGTGLDILRSDTSTSIDPHELIIDGVSAGFISAVGTANANRITKLVSGLPYGTHVARIKPNNNASGRIDVKGIIVYQPKTPSLPTNAVALGAYNIFANFAANTTAGFDTIATGVLRKHNSREIIYVNGTGGSDWASVGGGVTQYPSGDQFRSSHNGSYWEHTFFGYGFEYRHEINTNRSTNLQVQLQSLSTGGSLVNATTANFPTMASSTYGGSSFTPGTGVLNANASLVTNGGLRISGLPLGLWKVRVTNNAAAGNFIDMGCLDIITPIHSHKENGPFVCQNTLSVGSQGILDLRKFSKKDILDINNTSLALGIATDPGNVAASAIPMPDMSTIIKTSGYPIEVKYSATAQNNSASASLSMAIYINGVFVGRPKLATSSAAGETNLVADSMTIPVAAGFHKVDIYWSNAGAGSVVANGNYRSVEVTEKK